MIVDIIRNRRNPDERIAFGELEFNRYGKLSLPLFFSRKEPQPVELGQTEVMITGFVFHKDEDHRYDHSRPPTRVFIAVPDPEFTKVDYEGFCTLTSMAETMSSACKFGTGAAYREPGSVGLITPGRLMRYLPVADYMDGGSDRDMKPGIGWVGKHPMKNYLRLEGVADVKYLDFNL